MSASENISSVQAEIKTPSLSDLNPLNSKDPLLQTLAHGEVPSNSQLNSAIDRAKDGIESSAKDTNLTTRGEVLVHDATDILDSAQRLINVRNKDEKVQHLIQHANQVADKTSKEASRTGNALSYLFSNLGFKFPTGTQAKADEAYNYARELVSFAVRSPEFRSTLLEIISLFQSSIQASSQALVNVGDALKSDVIRGDTGLNATNTTANVKANEAKANAEHKYEEWTSEKQREYYNRFQNLLTRISTTPEYKRLLDLFWTWLDEVRVNARKASKDIQDKAELAKDRVAQSTQNVVNSSSLDKTWNDVRDIIDEFAGKGTFDSLYNQMWNLYSDFITDPQAEKFFDDLKAFVQDAMNNASRLNTDAKINEGQQLLERGRRVLNSPRYTERLNILLRSGQHAVDRIANDQYTHDFADKIRKFGEDFALDSQGRPDLYVMQESLSQIKNVVYPLLHQQLSAVTVSKITGTNDTYDWSVEDLLVSVPDLVPEFFELRTKNILSVNVKEMETERNNTKVVLHVKNIRPVFKDIKFWYQRKSFPKIEDYGHCDVDLSKGVGAEIKVIWKIKSKSNRPFAFSLMEVKCIIHSFDITVKDAKHELLDRVATTMFAANIKQNIAGAIVNNIVDSLEPFNNQMNDWLASRPITTLFDRANTQINSAYNQTNQFIKDQPMDRISHAVNQVKDAVGEKIESVKGLVQEKTQPIIDAAKEKTQPIIDAAQEKGAALVESVKESAVEAKDVVERKMDQIEFGRSKAPVVTPEENPWTHAWNKKSKKQQKKMLKKDALHTQDMNEFPAL